ncbi:MAG: alpha/beta hydrolase [Alphaproteobacteria bacterium]|nr:alpha/beta hydrolase [Alphaproteobacteria bacterium]
MDADAALDLSAIPPMADGRTAADHIADIEARSHAERVPMGNGGRMMWHVWGAEPDKPILVLLHGGGGSWLHWVRNVLPLSRHYALYVADLPGLGESDSPDNLGDVWSVTNCAKHAMDALLPKDRRFDIAGFSFGGNIGSHICTLYGDRVRSMTLVGPGGFRMKRLARAALTRLTRDMSGETLVAEARRNLEILMVHDPKSIDPIALHMQVVNSLRARTKSRGISSKGLLSDVVPTLRTRVNAIWGEFDSTAHPYFEEREVFLRAHHPGIDLRYIPGGGHWIAFEGADAFNTMLPDMLSKPTD